jgi:hypothetical protein
MGYEHTRLGWVCLGSIRDVHAHAQWIMANGVIIPTSRFCASVTMVIQSARGQKL